MVKAEPCNVRKKPNRKLYCKLRILKTGDLLFSLVSEFPVRIAAKQLLSDRGKNLLGDHLKPGLQGVVHLDLPLLSKNLQPPSSIGRNPVLRVKLHLTVLVHLCLVLGSGGWDDGLHQPLVHLPAPDEEGWLQQLAHALCQQLLQDLRVLLLVFGNSSKLNFCLLQDRGNVVISMLQSLQPCLIEHVAALDLLLEFYLLLFPLVVLHDLQSLLLYKPSFFDVELFFSFGINFFSFFIGFLLYEGHHMLDLFLNICIAESHLGYYYI